jgi:hypothetical protein
MHCFVKWNRIVGGICWFYARGKDEPDYFLEVTLVVAHADCIRTG